MSRSRTIDRLKRIAKEHNVKARFHKPPKPYGGFYAGDKKSIVVVTYADLRWLISAFFHELSHVLEHREGIYANYYRRKSTLPVRRKLALRAERHTDKRAQMICKKYFPKIRYRYGYRQQWQVEFLQDYFTDLRYVK